MRRKGYSGHLSVGAWHPLPLPSIFRPPHHRIQRRMSRVIAIANQKGGVGKTTTAINLGAGLAVAERRTLIVDMDPQGNATSGLGVDRTQLRGSVYELLMEDAS